MKPYYRILRVGTSRVAPVKVYSLKEAEAEALRLAGQHPGETLEIMQVLGTARMTEPSIFWNDTVEDPDGGTPENPDGGAPDGPGEGYRFLEPREVIENGDEVWIGYRSSWCRYLSSAEGEMQHPEGVGRRKLPEPQYRYLEPGERIEEGDEYQRLDGSWTRRLVTFGSEYNPEDFLHTRRLIPTPKPTT